MVDYAAGAESMQLTRAEFEERGVAQLPKLLELIALLSKPVTYLYYFNFKQDNLYLFS